MKNRRYILFLKNIPADRAFLVFMTPFVGGLFISYPFARSVTKSLRILEIAVTAGTFKIIFSAVYTIRLAYYGLKVVM